MPKHEMSETFCPFKWDEIVVNYNTGYVNACCKATPIKFYQDFKSVILKQKQNLLNGVKDESCTYCWEVEKNNKKSLRQEHLDRFNVEDYDSYLDLEKPPKITEINLGNFCNLQCIYCNPKFSSEWEKDINKKFYPIFTDRHVYKIESKNKKSFQKNINLLNDKKYEVIRILGGEPLAHKNLWFILDNFQADHIFITTNFMTTTNVIDRLIYYEQKFNDIKVNISLDTTAELAEFVRYGLKFDVLSDNITHYLKNSKSNRLTFNSVMTCMTVLEVKNFYMYILELRKTTNKEIRWALNNCILPKIQSFHCLPEIVRPELINFFKQINDPLVTGVDSIISALENTKFDFGLHKQLQYFLDDWELRKQVTLNTTYKELLCLK